MIIDTHQHFWTLSRGDYPWPDDSVAPIFRDFGPDDLFPQLDAANVGKTIIVQATDTVAETEFLLDIAATSNRFAGVVGWVDLSAPDAIPTIDRLRQNPALKGLRPMLQNIDDTDWILRPDCADALAHLAAVGLRFDALIQPRHLSAIAELAHRHPTLPIVIDHIAKPKMGDGTPPDDLWRDGMRAAATHTNVFCKLSGMVTEIGPHWTPGDLQAFADHLLDVFGPQRLMFGSDWPVVNLASDYAAWIDTAHALTAALSRGDQDAVFRGTAQNFYDIAT